MIRRLRRRFVLIAALSLLVVEGLIIGLINMINFYQIGSNEDKLLEIIVDNDGKFPDFGKHDKPEDMHGEMLREMNDSGSQAPPIPEEDMAKKGLGFINEETRYRTRFFSVTFDQELSATAIDTGNVAA
ncbi:MAG: two-component sensor histidine kinase, partial [Ruminococcus sp.]|nr:two-component sensor histidine kinase [Ruminococcus sp.]